LKELFYRLKGRKKVSDSEDKLNSPLADFSIDRDKLVEDLYGKVLEYSPKIWAKIKDRTYLKEKLAKLVLAQEDLAIARKKNDRAAILLSEKGVASLVATISAEENLIDANLIESGEDFFKDVLSLLGKGVIAGILATIKMSA
jgi:hypothetical protein